MQFKKPVISGLLAVTLLANLLMPAFAYNSTGSTTDRTTGSDTAQNAVTEYEETNNTSSETQVYATRSSTFTVLVPKTIILSGSTGLGQYVVGAKGDVLTEDSITIEPDSYELTLYRVDDHTKETPAKVTQGTTSVTGAQIEEAAPAYKTMEGSIQANGLKAGSWSTTMRFNIALNEKTTKPFTVTADNKSELGFNDTTTNLDIPSTFVDSSGENREVVGIDDNAFYDSNNLEKVTIPGSVESIGDNAFADCDNLGRVEVADEVKEIGNNAFGGVDEVIYGGAATGSPWGANNVYDSIDSIPSHTHTLEHVDRVEATEKVAGNIEYWHCTDCDRYYRDAGCTDEIALADTVIAQLPCNHNLTYVSGKNYWYCDKCGKYFSDENGANEILMQPFVITKENRAKIGYTDTTTNLVIPDTFKDTDGTWYKVTEIGEKAFERCEKLQKVTIGSSVKTIENYAFCYCSELTSVTIPNSVTFIGEYAFWGCKKLTNITVSSNNLSYSSVDGVLFNKDQSTIIQYPVSKIGASYTIPSTVTTIGEYAFYNCDNLTTVTIPNTVTKIELNAFRSMDKLNSITIPNSVTYIGDEAFLGCKAIPNVFIPESVEFIGKWAFRMCDNLSGFTVDANNSNYSSLNGVLFNKDQTELIKYPSNKTGTSYTVPDTVVTIKDEAFYLNSKLNSVKLGTNVEIIEASVFGSASALTSITLNDGLRIIGDSAFYQTKLKSVSIPNTVTDIYNSAFSSCTSLTYIKLPDGLEELANNTFYGCSALTTVILPSNLKIIGISKSMGSVPSFSMGGSNVFYNCTSLTSLTLPIGVTTIAQSAFTGCTKLNPLRVPTSVTEIGPNAFSSVPKVIYNGSLTSINNWGAKRISPT